MLYKRDLIAERDSWEKMKNSVVKWWQVNYINNMTVLDANGEKVVKSSYEEEDNDYNESTGSYSGAYGKVVTLDQGGLDQVESILHEKDNKIQKMFQESRENR